MVDWTGRHHAELGDWNIGLQLGPKLSFIVACILIMQTITYDPSASFRNEIASLLGSSAQVETYDPATLSSTSFRRFGVVLNDTEYSWGLTPALYSPSFWPYSDVRDLPSNSTGINATVNSMGRYPGRETVLTDYRADVIVPLEEFMLLDERKVTIPRDDIVPGQGPYATCRFMDYQYSFYFPHLAQQVFRCWSFWRANADKTPIFVFSQGYHWKLAMEKEFNREIMTSIQHAGVHVMNTSSTVAIVREQTSISARTKGPILHQSDSHYQVASKNDMPTFREAALSSLNLSQSIPPSFCGHPSNLPRIGILSRRNYRRIKNAKQIATDLTEHFNFTRNIPLAYFENAPFRNQVGMMASIDILITPHGAQETGIAFMPQCGGVLELLPNQYFFPRFYGTLAATAGLQHAYLYLAENTSDHRMDILQRDVGFLAPSMHRIKEGVTLLVEQWRACCERVNSES